MGISIDQLPAFDGASFYSDRWLFQLSEPLNGHHGGTFFVDGLATEPVDTRTFRKFICGFGHKMTGALRVEGGHVEIGDCSALLPPEPARKVVEAVPAKGELHENFRHALPEFDAATVRTDEPRAPKAKGTSK